MRKSIVAAAAALTVLSSAAIAAVTFDVTSGTGFVGKGDVQLALGLNNAGVQALGNPSFTFDSTSTTTWTCTKLQQLGNGGINEIVQVRNNSTSTQGVVSSAARVKNQITGYNLLGYSGTPTVTTDGPAIGACPANPSGFTYDDNAETQETGGGLSVNGVPLA